MSKQVFKSCNRVVHSKTCAVNTPSFAEEYKGLLLNTKWWTSNVWHGCCKMILSKCEQDELFRQLSLALGNENRRARVYVRTSTKGRSSYEPKVVSFFCEHDRLGRNIRGRTPHGPQNAADAGFTGNQLPYNFYSYSVFAWRQTQS